MQAPANGVEFSSSSDEELSNAIRRNGRLRLKEIKKDERRVRIADKSQQPPSHVDVANVSVQIRRGMIYSSERRRYISIVHAKTATGQYFGDLRRRTAQRRDVDPSCVVLRAIDNGCAGGEVTLDVADDCGFYLFVRIANHQPPIRAAEPMTITHKAIMEKHVGGDYHLTTLWSIRRCVGNTMIARIESRNTICACCEQEEEKERCAAPPQVRETRLSLSSRHDETIALIGVMASQSATPFVILVTSSGRVCRICYNPVSGEPEVLMPAGAAPAPRNNDSMDDDDAAEVHEDQLPVLVGKAAHGTRCLVLHEEMRVSYGAPLSGSNAIMTYQRQLRFACLDDEGVSISGREWHFRNQQTRSCDALCVVEHPSDRSLLGGVAVFGHTATLFCCRPCNPSPRSGFLPRESQVTSLIVLHPAVPAHGASDDEILSCAVMVCGMRNGTLQLIPIRFVFGDESGRRVGGTGCIVWDTTVRHPGASVQSLYAVDRWRFLSAGTDGSVNLWDYRDMAAGKSLRLFGNAPGKQADDSVAFGSAVAFCEIHHFQRRCSDVLCLVASASGHAVLFAATNDHFTHPRGRKSKFVELVHPAFGRNCVVGMRHRWGPSSVATYSNQSTVEITVSCAGAARDVWCLEVALSPDTFHV